MADKDLYAFTCPQCQTEGTVDAIGSVNVDKQPEMRAKIEDLSLFHWKCPHCGKVSLVLQPCLYHDMTEEFMVWFSPSGKEQPPHAKNIAQLSRYRLRITDSPNTFREKINILERNLDDRAVELVKFVLNLQLERDGMDLVDLVFKEMRDGNFVFVAVQSDGSEQTLETPSAAYEKFSQDMREIYLAPEGEFAQVDMEWAREVISLLHTM